METRGLVGFDPKVSTVAFPAHWHAKRRRVPGGLRVGSLCEAVAEAVWEAAEYDVAIQQCLRHEVGPDGRAVVTFLAAFDAPIGIHEEVLDRCVQRLFGENQDLVATLRAAEATALLSWMVLYYWYANLFSQCVIVSLPTGGKERDYYVVESHEVGRVSSAFADVAVWAIAYGHSSDAIDCLMAQGRAFTRGLSGPLTPPFFQPFADR